MINFEIVKIKEVKGRGKLRKMLAKEKAGRGYLGRYKGMRECETNKEMVMNRGVEGKN